jgi:hypothetical protein
MTALETLRAIRPRHLLQAPGVAYDETRAAWRRAIPRRTVIWGGRAGDRWVGSAEDLARARLKRVAAQRRRQTATLVALGRMDKSVEDAIAAQRDVVARITLDAGDFARAMRRTAEALEHAHARQPRPSRVELARVDAIRVPGAACAWSERRHAQAEQEARDG